MVRFPYRNVYILYSAPYVPVVSSLNPHPQLSIFPAQLLLGADQGIQRALVMFMVEAHIFILKSEVQIARGVLSMILVPFTINNNNNAWTWSKGEER
jgi:hypothetical protein